MKLNKYIQQLLADNEMVIIPGFGAFISEYQPAQIDAASDEIKPPSTRLIFNPQIRNNDGLLVGYVAENTRSSHFEALQKIEKERDNIIYQLDKGEKVELEGLGTLSYNPDNQIVFVSESDENLSHESFGLEATSLNEPEIIEEESKADFPAEPESVSPQNENTETDEEHSNEPEKEATEETVVNPVQEEVIIEETKPEEKPEKETLAPERPEVPEKEKKRKGGWIWILVVLLPLIAVSVFLLTKNKQPDIPPANNEELSITPEIKEEPLAVADSTAKDSTLLVPGNDSLVTEPEIVQTDDKNITKTSETKFYLIGGSFKEEENAATYMQVLRDKGFEPFEMGKYGNFYILGIGAYNTEEEAVAAKREFLDKSPDSGIWVLER